MTTILVQEDLPDNYVLLAGNSTPHLNYEILWAWGQEQKKAYLEATERLGDVVLTYSERLDKRISELVCNR